MKTYQITQNFGGGSLGFLYLDIEETAAEDQIKKKSAEMVQEDYDKRISRWLTGKALEKPTLLIKEYCRETHKVLRGGKKLKTRWR